MRKFYTFTSGKSETKFWCYKEFLKKLEIDNNEMSKNFSKTLRKFSVNFQDITILTKILKKLYVNFSKTSGCVKFFFKL